MLIIYKRCLKNGTNFDKFVIQITWDEGEPGEGSTGSEEGGTVPPQSNQEKVRIKTTYSETLITVEDKDEF